MTERAATPSKALRTVTVAALQCAFSDDMAENIAAVASMTREAAADGAQVILPPELFQSHYFCQSQDPKWFETAFPTAKHPCVTELARLAGELGVVIPISFFEKDGPHYYNAVAIAADDGSILGVYRKSHIPDGPGYQEKYYFRPGDTGFKVWPTRFGNIGVGICWDQWFPECARAMALKGADLLFYPTAIGSEPYDGALDTHARWQRVMQGHAVANAMPVVAANRHGTETLDGKSQVYYGHSFIADEAGEIVASAGKADDAILTHTFDLATLEAYRADWGFFRDRRPELYSGQ